MTSAASRVPRVSIVTTLYRSSEYIDEFLDRSVRAAEALGESYEFVFVDDGSPDDSAQKVKQHIDDGLPGTLIGFSRNFGHHNALMCGMDAARGEFVFLIDIDLEEKPEWLPMFFHAIADSEYQIVSGIQSTRNKNRFLGALFWRLLSRILAYKFKGSICTVRIMRQEYVRRLVSFPQKEFFIAEFTGFLGYKQGVIDVQKSYKGHSAYSPLKRIGMFLDMALARSSSGAYLAGLSVIAFGVAVVAFVVVGIYLAMYLKGERYLAGWLSIILMLSLFSAFNFFFLSAILKQNSRILREVENKPRYNIAYTYTRDGESVS